MYFPRVTLLQMLISWKIKGMKTNVEICFNANSVKLKRENLSPYVANYDFGFLNMLMKRVGNFCSLSLLVLEQK